MTVGQSIPDAPRSANQPLGPACRHKITEDCMVCRVCGHCRESLGLDEVCAECFHDSL
jgi:hypothetical protein